MPRKAFLKNKSLLDRFKDDYATHTGYIQSARAEHTWNNPLTRRKRTKELNRWIKSFAGKDHIHKLARFNATNAGRYESMYNEAMSLKGFLENLTEKLTKQFNLDAEKVQAYLDSHTQEMQELLDDKELSLKEKVLFVRSEITGEKDEARGPAEYTVHSYNDTDVAHYEDGTPEEWKCKRCGGLEGGEDGEPYGYYITNSKGKTVMSPLCSDCVDDACAILNATHGNISKALGVSEAKEPTEEKLGYEKGHKNSKGENAPWVIRSHEDNRILASFAKKTDAEEHLQRMKQYSKQESMSADELDKYIKDVKSLLKSKYGMDFNDKDTCRLNVGWLEKLDAMFYQGKPVEDGAKEVAAFCGYNKNESKQSESLADNPSDIHSQLSNLIKQDKIITFLNDVDGPVIYMDASKGSIPYGDYLLKYLGIDSSAMMVSGATVYNVEDIESYDILNGLSSSFVDSQKNKGINKVCKITTKYLTKPKKAESQEDGENSYDDYWTLMDGLKALGFEPSSDIRNGMIYPYRTHFTATKDGIKYVFLLFEDQTGEYLESIKVYGGIFDKGDPNDPDPTRFKSVSEVLDALKKVSDEPQKYEGADTTKEVNTVLKKNAPQLIDILNSKFKEAGFDVELKLTDPENARFSDGWYLKTKGTGNWTDPSRRLNLQLNGTEYKGVVYKDGAIYLKKGMRPTSHRGEVVNPLGIGESNSNPENTVTYELTEDAVTDLIKELGLEIVNTWYDGNKDRIVYDCKDKGDENGETVCVWIEPPYEARVWLKDVNPRMNQLVEDIETLNALKAALVDIFKIELGESHVTESLRKPEGTIIVPNWLWETYTLGENYDGDTLTDDEQQTYLDFKEKYERFSLKAVSEKTTFRSDNDFDSNGCPCYEVNVFKK